MHVQENADHTENKIARKGTGFVHSGELPPTDSEDEEEDPYFETIGEGFESFGGSVESAGGSVDSFGEC